MSTWLFFTLFALRLSTAQYNYLCGYDTSFTNNGGADWSWDPNTCHLTQSSNCTDCSQIVWLGDNIPDSLSWTNYTLTATLSSTSTLSTSATIGLVVAAQDIGNVDETNSGSYYDISICTRPHDII